MNPKEGEIYPSEPRKDNLSLAKKRVQDLIGRLHSSRTLESIALPLRKLLLDPDSSLSHDEIKRRVKFAKILMRTSAIIAGLSLGIPLGTASTPYRVDIVESLERFIHPATALAIDHPPPPNIYDSSEIESVANSIVESKNLGNDIVVSFDSEGTPVGFIGKYREFIPIEKEEYLKLKEIAIRDRKPQLLAYKVISTADGYNFYRYDESDVDHPLVPELPSDVLTTEQLEARGVRIVTSTPGVLRIRSSAFDPGGILDVVAPEHPLDIVILDGPLVSPRAIPDTIDIFYKDLIARAVPKQTTVSEFRLQRVGELMDRLALLETSLSEVDSRNPDKFEFISQQIVSTEALIRTYQQMSEDDLHQEQTVAESDYSGLFFPENPVRPKSVIVIGLGYIPTRSVSVLYLDVDGQLKTTSAPTLSSGVDQRSTSQLSHPSIDQYTLDTSASRDDPENHYPYGGQDPNLTLRHELQHYRDFRSGRPYDEYDTDLQAAGTIEGAYESWENGDDSLMPFYWLLPDGRYTQSIVPTRRTNKF